MRVLVAGDRGYIGAVLVPFLRGAGHQVDGLDVGLYEGCDFGAAPEGLGGRPARDIRDAEASQLADYDAVIVWPRCPMTRSVTSTRRRRTRSIARERYAWPGPQSRPASSVSCSRPRAACMARPGRRLWPKTRSCFRLRPMARRKCWPSVTCRCWPMTRSARPTFAMPPPSAHPRGYASILS